jgi:hypothetical protein
VAIKYECDRCKRLQNEKLTPVRPRDEDFADDFRDYRLRELSNKYELCEDCMILVAMLLNNAHTTVVVKPQGKGVEI